MIITRLVADGVRKENCSTVLTNPDWSKKKENGVMIFDRKNDWALPKPFRSGESEAGETAKSPVILAVSPFAGDRAQLARIFAGFAPVVRCTSTVTEALRILEAEAVAVVITESTFPEGRSWKHLLQATKVREVPPRLIIVSRLADERLWAEVLNLGGYDVLLKPFDVEEVLRVVSMAQAGWEHARARKSAARVVSYPSET